MSGSTLDIFFAMCRTMDAMNAATTQSQANDAPKKANIAETRKQDLEAGKKSNLEKGEKWKRNEKQLWGTRSELQEKKFKLRQLELDRFVQQRRDMQGICSH